VVSGGLYLFTMTLKEIITEEIYACGGGWQVEGSADTLVDKIEEIATDFLVWVFEDYDNRANKSANDLWQQFKIQKGL